MLLLASLNCSVQSRCGLEVLPVWPHSRPATRDYSRLCVTLASQGKSGRLVRAADTDILELVSVSSSPWHH